MNDGVSRLRRRMLYKDEYGPDLGHHIAVIPRLRIGKESAKQIRKTLRGSEAEASCNRQGSSQNTRFWRGDSMRNFTV